MVEESDISAFPIFLLDIVIVNLGLIGAYSICYQDKPSLVYLDSYVSLIPWISLLVGFIFLIFNLYSNWKRKSIHALIWAILMSVLVLLIMTLALNFLVQGFLVPARVIFIGAGIQVIFITLSRSLIWYLDQRSCGSQRVLIIAQDSKEGSTLAQKLLQHPKGWFIGYEFLPASKVSQLRSKFAEVDIVLISANVPQKAEILNLSVQYGKEILMVPEPLELFLLRSEPQQVEDMLVLSIRPQDLTIRQRFFKRLFDITVASILLILLSPIMILLFIVIPLSSKGPALFKQERLGKKQRKYLIYKFRSMELDAEKHCGPTLATEADPRITNIGQFIRAARLDELPQLINVLKGQMSLVGPRPERLHFVSQFKKTIPHYCYRMSIKPGITGLAQVVGKYRTTVEDKLRLDIMYIQNYSFVLDLKILCQTIAVVLRRQQACGVIDNTQISPEEVRLDCK